MLALLFQGKEDEDFEGPMRNRSCTDIICLIIFAAYVVFMVRFLKKKHCYSILHFFYSLETMIKIFVSKECLAKKASDLQPKIDFNYKKIKCNLSLINYISSSSLLWLELPLIIMEILSDFFMVLTSKEIHVEETMIL